MTDARTLGSEAIDRLTAYTDPWLSCDDCFEQVDAAIDALLDATAPLTEPFRVHLLSCAVCHEEASSLAALTAADHGLSEVEAAARLDAAVSHQLG